MKKEKEQFNKMEKQLIRITDLKNYTAFHCPDHRLFFQRNDAITGKCIYSSCSQSVSNISEEVAGFKSSVAAK